MAVLDKLQIRGMRNFGIRQDEEQEIIFTSPKTFIVGDNGTGKTTVIECIKYALTGNLPPNCKKNVDFINRPDILNVNESVGKVSLTVINAVGEPITVCRKSTAFYQENQGLVSGVSESVASRFDEKGEEHVLARLQADCSEVICGALGVSDAIVKYVLFCHQEDAYWFFDTDKNVRDRFEEIFDTKKYHKALEKLHQLCGKYRKEISGKETNLRLMQHCREYAVQRQSELVEQRNTLQEMQDNVNQFTGDLQPLKDQMDDLKKEESKIRSTLQQFNIAATNLQNKENTRESLMAKIQCIFDGTKDELVERMKEHEDDCRKKQVQLSEFEKKLTVAQHEHDRLEQQIARKDIHYQKLMRDHDLETYILNEIEWYKTTLQSDYGVVINGAFDINHDGIRVARERLQNRVSNLTDAYEAQDAEHEKAIELTYQKKFRVESEIASIVNRQQELNTKRAEFQALSPNGEQLGISNQIQEIDKRVKALDNEIVHHQKEKVELATQLAEADERFFLKVTKFEAANDENVKKRDDLSTLESLFKQRKSLAENIATVDKAIAEKNSEYRDLMKRTIHFQNEMLQMKFGEQKCSALQSCIQEVDDQMVRTTTEKEIKEKALSSIESEIKTIEAERLRVKASGREERDEAVKLLFGMELIVKAINRVWQQKPSSQNLVIEIDQCKTELDALKNQKLAQIDMIKSSDGNIRALNREFKEQHTQQLELSNNLELKNVQRDIEILENELRTLERQSQAEDIDRINTELESASREYNSLKTKKDVTSGQITQLNVIIENLQGELDKPEFRDSQYNCHVAEYELVVHEKAVKELELACSKIEKVMSEFHKNKMKKINRLIREYWENIYKGNDIEYIQIKTDETVSNANRRNFTYRVVGVKNGKTLDFRGQCSAGQRVLACLIIRLALADTFAAHCGVIALDEPTTNLDKSNIASLCEALNQIVDERQAENNFMLIVITHDKKFINQMDGGASCWRIERDEDTGRSRIRDENENDEVAA